LMAIIPFKDAEANCDKSSQLFVIRICELLFKILSNSA
jgi:hypothetical protein